MLRTLAINSNQIVLGFGVLIAFWSPKQSEIEESYVESLAKQFEAQKREELKLWSPLLPWVNPECKEKKQREICHEAYSWWQSCQPLLEHFMKSNLCMLYVVSKLRKSTIQCSNSVRFGLEMKELQPLQADHSKLKEEFCTALRNHPFVARWFRSLFV